MSGETSTAVVVLNWNGRAVIGPCLRALGRQTLEACRVFVVDNGSTDGSAELVAREFPWASLLRTGANLGFARGNNLGIQAALDSGAQYVAVLNNDTEAEPAWIEELVRAARAYPEAGILGSLLLMVEPAGMVNSTGLSMDVTGRVRDRDFRLPLASVTRDEGEVEGVSGGAMLLTRRLCEQVGMFDTDYFAYYEDVDLCLRARAAGFAVRYVPRAVVRHHFAGSGGEHSPRRRFLLGVNHLRMVASRLPWTRVSWIVPVTFAYRLAVKVPMELLRGRPMLAAAEAAAACVGALVAGQAAARRVFGGAERRAHDSHNGIGRGRPAPKQ